MNKIANALYAGRKILLLLWVILIVGFGFYAAKLPSVLGGNGFEMKGMYKDTEQLLVNKFDVSEAQIIVLFEKKTEFLTRNSSKRSLSICKKQRTNQTRRKLTCQRLLTR